jgi:negative regulator of flagellin synthesis FlgM
MHIHGTTHIHGPHGMNGPHINRPVQPSRTAALGGVDRVEISPAAEAAIQAAENGPIRHALVNSIRSQIAAGTYETPDKLHTAVERLLDEIG